MAEKTEGFAAGSNPVKEGVVTMCITNGLFVIGKLVGGNKLVDPRVFDLYMEQLFDKAGKPLLNPDGSPRMEERIRMRPLPGVPAYCIISQDALKYPVVNSVQNILPLYKRVTEPAEEKPSIIMPERGPVSPSLN
jgi:hypothetical protein